MRGRFLQMLSCLYGKLSIVHMPTKSQSFQHALHRAEDASSTSRLVLLDPRSEVHVCAVRHERSDGQNVRLRFSLPYDSSIVYDDREFGGKVSAARRAQRFHLVHADGLDSVLELCGFKHRPVRI